MAFSFPNSDLSPYSIQMVGIPSVFYLDAWLAILQIPRCNQVRTI